MHFSKSRLTSAVLRQVDTRIPSAVEEEVRSIHRGMFPDGDRALVSRAFDWVTQCFSGRYEQYQAIDARYHDLEHTLQGTLCFARLLQGCHRARATPELTTKMFELGLLAILFHDTGYLKERGDTEGTGAKFTLIHVDRSAQFARLFLSAKGYAEGEIKAIQNMIHCTGVNVNLSAIAFASDLERNVGFALGTADLLGQMAAHDYIDKLPILYLEFAESARYNAGKATAVGTFTSADDLMRKTPIFWEKYVLPKINTNFLGLYKYLNEPYPDGPNYYLQRIEGNFARLRQQLAGGPAA
ncbi:MAG TPA: hypothetical protein VGK40_07585 [Verrucomicrobiae bacterium]